MAGVGGNPLFDIDALGATDNILLMVSEGLAVGGRDRFDVVRSVSS